MHVRIGDGDRYGDPHAGMIRVSTRDKAPPHGEDRLKIRATSKTYRMTLNSDGVDGRFPELLLYTREHHPAYHQDPVFPDLITLCV
jgi:hypothetical protein